MKDFSDFWCPWVAKEELWQKAEAFRSTYWPKGTLPVDMERIVDEGMRLHITPIDDLFRLAESNAFLTIDLSGIAVDKEAYLNGRYDSKLRFSFAHEVGHYVLHSDLFKSLDIKNIVDWRDFMQTVSDRAYSSFEFQANEFAGRLLVPRDKLRSELYRQLADAESNGILEYLPADSDAVLATISPTLCRAFGVNQIVIEIRVKREGLWPPKH